MAIVLYTPQGLVFKMDTFFLGQFHVLEKKLSL